MAENRKKSRARLYFQACWFAVTNGYLSGFINSKIFRGASKKLCIPGLNCYSCPGALFACPIGALQAVMDSGTFKFSCYVFGFLVLTGTLIGRFVCGWLCPFGLVQELIYKIPFFRKMKNLPGHAIIKYLKYAVLAVFVIILPVTLMDKFGAGVPWFCKFICPSGTLFGGIPLIAGNETLRTAVGLLFSWKVCLLLLILLLSLISYRPFCKYLCPLGAVYGFFNAVSFIRIEIDRNACTGCGKCSSVCMMDVNVLKNPNSMECIRCGSCRKECPVHAIDFISARRSRISAVTEKLSGVKDSAESPGE